MKTKYKNHTIIEQKTTNGSRFIPRLNGYIDLPICTTYEHAVQSCDNFSKKMERNIKPMRKI